MSTLYDRTYALLRERMATTSLQTISRESDLPYYWLNKISIGATKDPGVRRVQKLYEYLTGKPLELS